MTRVQASVRVPGRVSEAEALWYDTQRWPGFIDGFGSIVELGDAWPREGRLVWNSKPSGRGRVVERVERYEARASQTSAVEDEEIRGTQELTFEGLEGEETRVTLALEYEIKDRKPLTPLVDLLFIRRAFRDSLRRTLSRYATERRSDHELIA